MPKSDCQVQDMTEQEVIEEDFFADTMDLVNIDGDSGFTEDACLCIVMNNEGDKVALLRYAEPVEDDADGNIECSHVWRGADMSENLASAMRVLADHISPAV